MPEQGLTLGEKIRSLRRQMRMTQAELAGVDFTKSFISQIEKNQARPSLRSLQILAHRLNRPVSYFLEDEPTIPPAALHQALSTGQLLETQGKYEPALQVYDQALSECGATDFRGRGELQRRRARVLVHLDQLPNAVQALQLAAEEFRLARETSARAEVDRELGNVYNRIGDRERAIHHYERALLLYEESLGAGPPADSAFVLVGLLTQLGLTCHETGDEEAACRYLQRAERISREHRTFYRWGELCRVLSAVMERQGERERALEYAQRAVSFFDSTQDNVGLVHALIGLGTLKAELEGREAAEACFSRALLITEEVEYAEGKSLVLAALAKLAAGAGNLDQAVQLYQEAAASARDHDQVVDIHRSLAQLFRDRCQWDDAVRHLEAAIAVLEKTRQPKALAEAYSFLAEVYEAQGASDAAARCLKRSVELYRNI
ncbi:MAG: tetratricopeptide repeat protein [Firmicutes bacterium]|nr:tetratricopeptide repeat protein [Bacillota bacterium]